MNSTPLDDKDEFHKPILVFGSPGVGKSALIRRMFPNAVEFKMSPMLELGDFIDLPVVPHGGDQDALRR